MCQLTYAGSNCAFQNQKFLSGIHNASDRQTVLFDMFDDSLCKEYSLGRRFN